MMNDPLREVHPRLTVPDTLVLKNLLADVDRSKKEDHINDEGYQSLSSSASEHSAEDEQSKEGVLDQLDNHNQEVIQQLRGFNDAEHEDFRPTVFFEWDVYAKNMPPGPRRWVLEQYVRMASAVVRNKLDVVMFTHLLLYFTTSVPSALFLFYRFSYWHGILHSVMQVWYAGSYTLMMHQHIHMGGILDKKFAFFDHAFPYITDPLHGHTWNSYYYHHVKHHHVEGNGPDDLSSTIRYERDNVWHFLHYWARFFLLIWLDLPRYFLRKNKPKMALKAVSFELTQYTCLFLLATRINFRATFFVFLIPLLTMRIGLMIGNWGQHAFVDEIEPDSDFRSSITLIDVASNRYCFNDGYHTSHHLNPRRHWRDHPIAFMQQKTTYASEKALVFHNIDYLMITFKLLCKDYDYLARCLVPMGEEQIGMSTKEIAAMLKTKTRAFTEEEIRVKFGKGL